MPKRLWMVAMSFLFAGGCRNETRLAPLLPPCTAAGDTISLPLQGDYGFVDPGPIEGCMVFPANSSASPAEYLLVAQAATGTPNVSGSFILQGAALAAAGMVPTRAPRIAPAPLTAPERLHLLLRQNERDLAQPVGPSVAPRAAAPALAPVPDDSGSVRQFKVCGTDRDKAGNITCKVSNMVTVTATAQKVGTHLAIYVDNAAPSGGLSQQDLDSLRAVFDGRLYGIDHSAFGTESDIDNNGMVRVLLTARINMLCDTMTKSFVIGLFDGRDLIPKASGGTGNNGEVFYAVAADPSGASTCGSQVAATSVMRLVPATFAHEFQHMISFNQHYFVNRGFQEDLWLNEAMSHYAQERAGRSFLPDTVQFCNYSGDNLVNAHLYLQAPDAYFVIDTAGIGGIPERGGYWLLLRFLIDQFSADTSVAAADAFTQTLDQTRLTGAANLVAHTNNTPFPRLLSRWSLANWVSDLPGFIAPDSLRYKSYAFRSAFPVFAGACPAGRRPPSTFPLVPGVGLGDAVNLVGTLRAGTGTYYRAQQTAGGSGFTLLFGDGSGRALRASLVPMLNVIRIQ